MPPMTGQPPFDLEALRRRLAGTRGRAHWRTLEEAAGAPEFLAFIEDEFPRFAAAAAQSVDRRRLLQVMAASMALAGLAGCGPEPEPESIVPYVKAPPDTISGVPRFFATATTPGGYAE